MKGQYEQQCNAAALEKMGVKVIESLKASSKKGLDDFFNSNEKVNVNYPNQTDEIIRKLVFENVASGYVVTTDSFSFSR